VNGKKNGGKMEKNVKKIVKKCEKKNIFPKLNKKKVNCLESFYF